MLRACEVAEKRKVPKKARAQEPEWEVTVHGELSAHQRAVCWGHLMGLPMPEARRRAALVREEFDRLARERAAAGDDPGA